MQTNHMTKRNIYLTVMAINLKSYFSVTLNLNAKKTVLVE